MTTAAPPPTFAALLEARLRDQPGAPLVTFYDDATDERTELSTTSFANWVAKHANLLRDELDLDDGDTVLVDLPPHWLVPVLLGGAWTAGLAVTTDVGVPHDLVVTADPAAHPASGVPVVACSLHPFALPAAEPLPPGVMDHGHLWPGQSDVYVGLPPTSGDEVGWRDHEETTQSDLLADAAARSRPGRLMTTRHPAADRGVGDLLAPLLGGSVVYVRRPDPARWESRATQERVDRVHAAPGAVDEPGQPPSV